LGGGFAGMGFEEGDSEGRPPTAHSSTVGGLSYRPKSQK
jgi:hypothetical protein